MPHPHVSLRRVHVLQVCDTVFPKWVEHKVSVTVQSNERAQCLSYRMQVASPTLLECILPVPQGIIDKVDIAVTRQLVHPVRDDP